MIETSKDVGKVATTYKGSWDGRKAYSALDIVFVPDVGTSYVALVDNKNISPVDNPGTWGVFAQAPQDDSKEEIKQVVKEVLNDDNNNIKGEVAKARSLAIPVKINDVDFDGTQNLTLTAIPSNDDSLLHVGGDENVTGVKTFAIDQPIGSWKTIQYAYGTDLYKIGTNKSGSLSFFPESLLSGIYNKPFESEPFFLETLTSDSVSDEGESNTVILRATNALTGEVKVAINKEIGSISVNRSPWKGVGNTQDVNETNNSYITKTGDEVIAGSKTLVGSLDVSGSLMLDTSKSAITLSSSKDKVYLTVNDEGNVALSKEDGSKATISSNISGVSTSSEETKEVYIQVVKSDEEHQVSINDILGSSHGNTRQEKVILDGDNFKDSPVNSKQALLTLTKMLDGSVLQTVQSVPTSDKYRVEVWSRKLIVLNDMKLPTPWFKVGGFKEDELVHTQGSEAVSGEKTFTDNVTATKGITSGNNVWVSGDVNIEGRDSKGIKWTTPNTGEVNTTLSSVTPGNLKIVDDKGIVGNIRANLNGGLITNNLDFKDFLDVSKNMLKYAKRYAGSISYILNNPIDDDSGHYGVIDIIPYDNTSGVIIVYTTDKDNQEMFIGHVNSGNISWGKVGEEAVKISEGYGAGEDQYLNMVQKPTTDTSTQLVSRLSDDMGESTTEGTQIPFTTPNILEKVGEATVTSSEGAIDKTTFSVYRRGNEWVLGSWQANLLKEVKSNQQLVLNTTFTGQTPPNTFATMDMFLDNEQPVITNAKRVDNGTIKVQFGGSIRRELGTLMTFGTSTIIGG